MVHKRISMILVAFLLVAGFTVVPVLAQSSGKININTASAEELMQLKGIGEKMAERIVAFREANGSFQTPEDLMQVKGVGEKMFEKIRDQIVVEFAKKG
jgi:competence protein ComEA